MGNIDYSLYFTKYKELDSLKFTDFKESTESD
jgi:hypothetical protein